MEMVFEAGKTAPSAPEASKPILVNIKKDFGFIPNLMATFANSPTVLQGYLALDGVFDKGTFTPVERQLILLAASVENDCNYCTDAHSTIASSTCMRRFSIWRSLARRSPNVPPARRG
jgi:alkylhydroperoxidase family enzyme